MIVSKKIEIDMGHRIPNHKSKCRNLHGHRYKIEVGVDDKIITKRGSSEEGMVIDFSDLKDIMMEEIDKKFDHGLVLSHLDEMVPIFNELKLKYNQKITFLTFTPTAENLAKYWYSVLKASLKRKGIKIKYVRVYETPNSMAQYEG